MAYRMPGWYKEMFQGFQHSVEELFPESQPQNTPAPTSTYIPCCNVHTSLLLTARMSVYACLSVYWRAGASLPSRPTGAMFLFVYIYPALMYAVMFYVILNKRKRLGDCVTFYSRSPKMSSIRLVRRYLCVCLCVLSMSIIFCCSAGQSEAQHSHTKSSEK